MAVKSKSRENAKKEAISAASILDGFTDAAHSAQNIGGWDQKKQGAFSSYKDGIKELEGPLSHAIHGNELSRDNRQSMNVDKEARAAGGSLDEFKEFVSKLVKSTKDSEYHAAVERISRITKDLNELAKLDSEAAKGDKEKQKSAYYMLNVLITDFSVPESMQKEGKERQAHWEKSQTEKDLEIIRSAAVVEKMESYLKNQNKAGEQQAGSQRTKRAKGKSDAVEEKHAEVSESVGKAAKSSARKKKPESAQPVIFDVNEINTPEKMAKQQEIMARSIEKRAKEFEEMAAKLGRKSREEITGRELGDISDTNVKLFIEINAYTDRLLAMKDSLEGMIPGAGQQEKEQRRKYSESIDALVEHIEEVGIKANETMKELGDSKNFGVRRIPMFTHNIRDIQADMYGIRDSSGNRPYEKLGVNAIAFDEGRAVTSMEKQMDDYYNEILKGLSSRSRAMLSEYEIAYPDISELVIAQLAAIGVQLGKYEGKEMQHDAHMPLVFRKVLNS